MVNQEQLVQTPDRAGTQINFNSASMSDEYLAAAVCQGRQGALEELYERYVRKCFGLALKIVHDYSLAEEIVQDVFVKFWSRPDTFCAERGPFYGWIAVLVRNRSLDKLRQARSRSALSAFPLRVGSGGAANPVDMVPDTAPSLYDQAWAGELRSAVADVLQQLPDTECQIILLAYFGGYTQMEIANMLQQPLGTVKTRNRAALRRLHSLLEAAGALPD